VATEDEPPAGVTPFDSITVPFACAPTSPLVGNGTSISLDFPHPEG